MDFFALTNINGYIKAGSAKNIRPKELSRPATIGRQDDPVVMYDGFGVPAVTINMKTHTSDTLTSDKKSTAFADILRSAYEQKLNAQV